MGKGFLLPSSSPFQPLRILFLCLCRRRQFLAIHPRNPLSFSAGADMAKTRSEGRARASSQVPPTAVTKKKRKRAAARDGKKKPWEANETMGKWFPSVVSLEELRLLVVDKSMAADLEHRIPDGEIPPTPRDGEHVIHQEYFGRGLGFPLHSFVCGLLRFYGCQLHHIPPNGVLHITNFITFCECFLGTAPHFELFRYFFRVRV